MVLDVSHTNEKTFWGHGRGGSRSVDRDPFQYPRLCEVHRNLTDQQIMAIGAKGGLIGLNAAKNFIDPDLEHQDARIWRHMAVIADLVGVEHLAVGFDFMDFFEDHATSMAAICPARFRRRI